MKKNIHPPLAALLKQIGREEKIKIELEPRWRQVGRIIRTDGTVSYFRGSNFDLNGLGSAMVAKDKNFTNYFLKRAGFRVIPGRLFHAPEFARQLKDGQGLEAAGQYAKKIGWPAIVKPNSLSQGQLVCLAFNWREFKLAVKRICQVDRNFLVQPRIFGRDYRVVVLDKKVISVYERLPLTIIGDGRAAINQLINKKQRQFAAIGRDTVIDATDFRVDLTLKKLKLNRAAVLTKGRTLALLANCNLSSGGSAIDVTSQTHASFKNLAINITRAAGLRYCGVDLMIEKDIKLPLDKTANNYYILEVNASPGLDHYAQSGAKQRKIVAKMYRQILKKMIGAK